MNIPPLSTVTLMGALLEPMVLLPTHMYVPASESWTSGMSRVPMSVRSMRAWRRHTERRSEEKNSGAAVRQTRAKHGFH